MPPSNRKERRAQSRSSAPSTGNNIPFSQPSRTPPTSKTLYEIAAERSQELEIKLPANTKSITTASINTDGSLTTEPTSPLPDDDPIGPLGHAIILTVTLTMLHFTLDVLVYHQYAQTISWPAIVKRTLIVCPLLFILVYILSPRSQYLSTQILFGGMSVAAGCYMIYSSNEEAYFAVMKRAPPLGTLWVWSVKEMRLVWAVASLAVVGAYFWWVGYTIF